MKTSMKYQINKKVNMKEIVTDDYRNKMIDI